jgi:N-glycosylase/DNA lyase
MDSGLLEQVKKLKKSAAGLEIEKRLKEFKALGKKGNKEWFSELCFCILTANSKAETALKIQAELAGGKFHSASSEEIKNCIIKYKHRFHNNKTKYIIEARKHISIKEKLQNAREPREWMAENIKGIGYKEASHFLRNIGCENYAILDRHIISLMMQNKMLKAVPKLNKKNYLEIEKKFIEIAKKAKMSPAKLDLYMWFMRTGRVLK